MTPGRTTSAVVGALIAVVMLVGAAPAQPLDDRPRGSGVGDPYFPLDGNRGIDVQNYRIKVAYDFDNSELVGRTTLRLRATTRLTSFSLDFLLAARSVQVDGKPATFHTERGHELVVTPRAPLAAGSTHKVTVRYRDEPAKYAYAGEQNWLASAHEVVAINEPHMAPWWFPSNDHPSDRATVDITVVAPRGREAIANGHLVGKRRVGDQVAWRWRADEPMATYLAFFALGDFVIDRGVHQGLPWLTAVSESMSAASTRSARRWVLRTPAIADWLASEIGPYPFSATGGVVTSLGFGFALENQTRPVYPFMGTSDTLLVHELAHQWFGDALTVGRWRDIWLNEGFATYFEKRWEETHGGPSADLWLRQTYDSWAAGPGIWQVNVSDPGVAHLFGTPVYDRGGMTLVALRRLIGRDVFATVIRRWAAEHRHTPVTTAAFEALAEQVSGRDLDAFFNTWLRSPTKPADTAANGLR